MQRLEVKYHELKDGKDYIAVDDYKGSIIDKNNMTIKCKKTIVNYEAPLDPKAKQSGEIKTSSVNCVDWN